MKIPTYAEIQPYIERKLVTVQFHPLDADVAIFNYSQSCQFQSAWDDVTRQCRGLIMNIKTGEVLARPFPKFFNYGEHIAKGWPIPSEKPVALEKLDGSLGILYQLNGIPLIATRGSFVSEQAKFATGWYKMFIDKLPEPGHTHLFEIIYPQNRIVVNYDYSGLVHLATIDNESGRVIEYEWGTPIRQPKRMDDATLEELALLDEPNSEGFVVFFPEENVRIKIKFPEYVRLHKLVTGISEIAIWEHLREGKTLDELLEKVPDEFFKWVKDVEFRLRAEYLKIENEALQQFRDIDMVGTQATRKDWAERISRMTNPGIGFAMLDSKDYSSAIWRMVRPRGQSSFKIDIDS